MSLIYKIVIIGISAFFMSSMGLAQLNQVDSQGRKQGEWVKFFDEQGYGHVMRYKGEFKNDKPIGKFVYYYPSKKVRAIIVHEENSPRSEAFFYYENEALTSHGIYRNGEKDSIWTNFTESGFYSTEETYRNGELNGKRTIFYGEALSDKKQKLPLRVDQYKDGELNGESIEYFPDSKIKTKATYKDGAKVGIVMHYHPNGKPSIEEHWKNRKKHGLWKTFDESGKEIGRRYFKNGVTLEGKALDKYLAELKANGLNPNQ